MVGSWAGSCPGLSSRKMVIEGLRLATLSYEALMASAKERLRSGRKAFLRCEWARAKGCFLSVLEGPSSEEEKSLARRYLTEIYLLEGRGLRARRAMSEVRSRAEVARPSKTDRIEVGRSADRRLERLLSSWMKRFTGRKSPS